MAGNEISLIEAFEKVSSGRTKRRYFTEMKDNVLTLGFTGASDSAAILCFLTFKSIPYTETGMDYLVHEGVLTVWKEMLPELRELLLSSRDMKVRIIGYSFGGVMAYLCHDLAKSLGIDVISIIFESPKIFKRIPHNARSRFDDITSVLVKRSPIPLVMPGFKRPKTGKTIRLKPQVRGLSIVNHMEQSIIQSLNKLVLTFKEK